MLLRGQLKSQKQSQRRYQLSVDLILIFPIYFGACSTSVLLQGHPSFHTLISSNSLDSFKGTVGGREHASLLSSHLKVGPPDRWFLLLDSPMLIALSFMWGTPVMRYAVAIGFASRWRIAVSPTPLRHSRRQLGLCSSLSQSRQPRLSRGSSMFAIGHAPDRKKCRSSKKSIDKGFVAIMSSFVQFGFNLFFTQPPCPPLLS